MAIVRALVLLTLAAVVLFLLPHRREDGHSAWSEPDDGIQPLDPWPAHFRYSLTDTRSAGTGTAVVIGQTLHHTH